MLEGSVERIGDRVRITAQLIDGRTDQHVWAESYDRELKDVLALQSEVARQAARAIHVRLTPEDQARNYSAAQRVGYRNQRDVERASLAVS